MLTSKRENIETTVAITHARDALDDLDRFGPPASVKVQDWTELKRKLTASAYFALGRASLSKALDLPSGAARTALIADCESSLSKAVDLNSTDAEPDYLLGLARLVSGKSNLAAASFARVYKGGGEFAAKALQNLRIIYAGLDVRSQIDFESFLKQLGG